MSAVSRMARGKKPTAYVVEARYNYEPGYTVKVFLREEAALEFAAACGAYAKSRPECPADIEDSPENDAAFEKYWRASQRWSKRHPAGEHASNADEFAVVGVELVV